MSQLIVWPLAVALVAPAAVPVVAGALFQLSALSLQADAARETSIVRVPPPWVPFWNSLSVALFRAQAFASEGMGKSRYARRLREPSCVLTLRSWSLPPAVLVGAFWSAHVSAVGATVSVCGSMQWNVPSCQVRLRATRSRSTLLPPQP